ncbi:MAG TPA: cysteine-rich CWC family protein [Candidatus Kapabacteria bacterium]|nr:cysteine-rich CWC family protein [Candidatus Kapabacteria bacterium]
MPATFDPARCPLCAAPNHCTIAARAIDAAGALAAAGEPCWCETAAFAPEALEAVPEDARGRACLCARCAAGPNNQQFLP